MSADLRAGTLRSVVDLDVLRGATLNLGVDPLGGAGVHYQPMIGERYQIPLTVVSDAVDPTFRFMTVDWDGKIRMDCSSSYAMQRLIALKDRFDVAWACDTDHDRHGIVTRRAGSQPLPPPDPGGSAGGHPEGRSAGPFAARRFVEALLGAQ